MENLTGKSKLTFEEIMTGKIKESNKRVLSFGNGLEIINKIAKSIKNLIERKK